MGCIKCGEAWVCGPGSSPDCTGLEAIVRPPTKWRYVEQKELTVGTWWVTSKPACKGVDITKTKTPGAWELTIDAGKEGYYIVLCRPGGGGPTQKSDVGLIKTLTP